MMRPKEKIIAKPKNIKNTARRIMFYINQERLILILIIILSLLASLMITLPAMISGPLVDKLLSLENLNLVSNASGVLLKYIIWYFIIALVGLISMCLRNKLVIKLGQKFIYKLREDLFAHMKLLPIRYFDTTPHGEIMSKFTNDIETISDFLNNSFAQFISGLISLISSFVLMLYLNFVLCLITCMFFFLMLRVSRFILNKSKYNFRAQQDNLGILNGFIEEHIEGQIIIKTFSCTEHIEHEFNLRNKNYINSAIKAQIYSGVIMPIIFNLNNLNYALSTAIGAVFILFNKLTIGKLTSFLQLIRQFGRPASEISSQLSLLQSALAGAERIFELIDEVPEINSGKINLKNNNYQIEFNHVSFAYQDKMILKDICFVANPGEKIALVGPTGAGKTTIANLITRFYDINNGEIKINGVNINKINLHSLRNSIGLVLQDTHLFQDSILENIRYGKLNASDLECEKAAEISNAHCFIKNLSKKYHTKIYDDGKNLSHGQRQLLSIARVAVNKPAILILDEATSSVDTRTEKLIQAAMNELMRGRTSFIIAHRLSTIRNADKIIVLQDGYITEMGSHEELIKQKKFYYKLYTGQIELD